MYNNSKPITSCKVRVWWCYVTNMVCTRIVCIFQWLWHVPDWLSSRIITQLTRKLLIMYACQRSFKICLLFQQQFLLLCLPWHFLLLHDQNQSSTRTGSQDRKPWCLMSIMGTDRVAFDNAEALVLRIRAFSLVKYVVKRPNFKILSRGPWYCKKYLWLHSWYIERQQATFVSKMIIICHFATKL